MTRSSSQLATVMRTPALLVWCAYVLLIPFYVFKGGLPQPGDVLIIVLVPMSLSVGGTRLPARIMPSVRALLAFTGWVVLVDLTWAVLLNARGLNLLFPAYYVYNTAFFIAALVLYRRFGKRFLEITLATILISVVFQVGASFVITSSLRRGSLFFSNPNQLGYYALLAGCVVVLGRGRVPFSTTKTAVVLVGCTYLTILSGSRSAVAGMLFLIVLSVFTNLRTLILSGVLALLFSMVGGPLASSLDTLQHRLANQRQPNLTFFEQRGYDRIWANKQHLLFGAGEGNTARFADSTAFGDGEIHSSAGTLLFCYGSIGVVLFGAFLWRLLQGLSIRTALMLVPPLSYGFAHQGLRFTMLWVLFGLFAMHKVDTAPPLTSPKSPS